MTKKLLRAGKNGVHGERERERELKSKSGFDQNQADEAEDQRKHGSVMRC